MLDTMKDAVTSALDAVGVQDPEIREAEKFYERALEEQKPYHPVWFQNIAYYLGQHYLEWDYHRGRLHAPPKPAHRVRLTVNLVQPLVRTAVAKVLKADMIPTGIPVNDSEEAEGSARVSTRLYESRIQSDDFARLRYDVSMWRHCTGQGFLWALWDPDAGDELEDGVKTGDVRFEATGPFETLLDPTGSHDFRKHRRIMRLQLLSTDEIKARWGKEVKPEDLRGDLSYQLRLRAMVDAQGNSKLGESRDSMQSMALVKYYFELPSEKYPLGRMFIYANGVRLTETAPIRGEYEYDGAPALPVEKFDDITVPGRVYSASMIENIAPINVVFNRLTSMGVEHLNLNGSPKWFVPVGSIEEDQITDQPEEVIEYTPIGSHKPESAKPPELSQTYFQLKDALPALMREVAGIFDASLGKLPRRATSGKAIDLLQESDETRLGLLVKNDAGAYARIFSIALNTMKQRYTEDRIAEIVGESRRVEIIQFKGDDLKLTRRVAVELIPSLSRQQKVSIAMQLAESQSITVEEALKVMELGNLNLIFDRSAAQSNYAMFENMGFAKGIAYPVGELEDHKAHVQAHIRFLNSPAGQRLTPEARAGLTAHIQEHNALMAAANPIPQAPVPPPPVDPGEDLAGGEGGI